MASKKEFFEQQIKEQQPKKIKKEVAWTPNQGKEGYGANEQPGFKVQTKAKLNLGEPPAKKNISDLP